MNLHLTSAKSVLANHSKLGLSIPTKVTEAADAIGKLTAGIEALRTSPDELASVVVDAILADRDPATDPQVVRALVANHLVTDDLNKMESIVTSRFFDAYRAAAKPLIEQWRTVFNESAKTIELELKVLGRVNLANDADVILNRGGDIAEHFIAARDANPRCELVRDTMHHYGQTSRQFEIDRQRKWNLVVVPATLQQWEALELGERHTTWQLAAMGLTLEFASPAEYRARLAEHEATREARNLVAFDRMTGRQPNLASDMKRLTPAAQS